jgi:uncharacterized protein YcfJ
MVTHFRLALALIATTCATQAAAQVTFYEREGFGGRSFTTSEQVGNMSEYGFNDRASSVIVGRQRWEVCEDAGFNGRCTVLNEGRYGSLAAMGLNDRISSVRVAHWNGQSRDVRYAPAPEPVREYQRRNNERLYEANVTSVRAVVDSPEQRCWVDREQVTENRSEANVPGAVVGAVLGGILGHQVGGGRGRDLTTAGGAVAGAVVGANVNRQGQSTSVQDVKRCETVSDQGRPAFWDVSYNFRGQDHRVQMTSPPGSTVTVNRLGEPRN